MAQTVEFTMPKLGEVMEEGTVVAWRKAVGDHVDKDEILAEIETDKSTLEVASPVAGTIAEILVAQGVTKPVGALLARITVAGR